MERWLREMWWVQPYDSRLLFAATPDRSVRDIDDCLGGYSRYDAEKGRYMFVDERPYLVVATPEVMWGFYERRKAKMIQREKAGLVKRRNFSLTPVIASVDTLIVDEVDAVLPSNISDAPGNLLLGELYRFVKFQAPIQLIFNSATLSGSTVNHVRRFMKKNMLESKSSRIFETEAASVSREEGAAEGYATPASARSLAPSAMRAAGNAESLSTAERTRRTSIISKVTMPASIQHLFMTADTPDEQRECIMKVLAKLAAASSEHQESFPQPDDGATGSVLRALFVLPNDESQRQQDEFIEAVLKPAFVHCCSALAVPVVHVRASAKERVSMSKSVTNDDGSSSAAFVCLADAARGLNFASLDVVVILCRPRTMLEYAHLAGRVGRMGQAGLAVTVMQRSFVRVMSAFCDSLGLPFRVERRFEQVYVPPPSACELEAETSPSTGD
jgi:hypothetical protein